jgi:DnaD/phage-associated family protein
MANYRQIHVSIWKDEWFLDLQPDEKLLFIYLFSNSETNMAGIYKIAFPVICFETCLSGERVREILDKFQKDNKIMYQDGVMWVKKMRRYHQSKSPKVEVGILNDLENIPYCEVKIQYLYCMDTESQQEQEQNKNNNNNDNKLGDIFSLYEQNIGVINPLIAEQIQSTYDEIPVEDKYTWFQKAITEAAKSQARNWRYIHAILSRWIAAGKITTRAEQKIMDDPELAKLRRQAQQAQEAWK